MSKIRTQIDDLKGPNRYRIKVLEDYSYSLIKIGKMKKRHFTKPETSNVQKLYVLHNSKNILYVGITSQKMSSRIRSGLKSKGQEGYYGYPWKHRRDWMTLSIWHIEKNKYDLTIKSEFETIEAELVFLTRKNSGQWPIEQSEIHFQASNRFQRKLVSKIYREITSKNF